MPEEKQIRPEKSEPFVSTDQVFHNPEADDVSENFFGIFNKEDNIKVISSSDASENDIEDVPTDVLSLLKENGFGDAGKFTGARRSNFRLILKQVVDGKGEGHWPILASYRTRELPTVQHVMERFGSGKYAFAINWKETDRETKQRYDEWRYVEFSISEKIEKERKWKQYEQTIARAQRLKEKAREAQMEENIFDQMGIGKGTNVSTAQESVKDKLKELMEFQSLINNSQRQGTDWGEILKNVAPLIIPMLPNILNAIQNRAMQQNQRFEKMMFLLIANKDESHKQMLELMQNNGNNGGNNFMEMMNMAREMIDFKRELSPEKESILDKVMGAVEGLGPVLIQMLRMPAPARKMAGVDGKIAEMKEHPDFQQIIHDKEMFSEAVRRLDTQFGNREDTDSLLEAIGMPRPGKEVKEEYNDNLDEENDGNESEL